MVLRRYEKTTWYKILNATVILYSAYGPEMSLHATVNLYIGCVCVCEGCNSPQLVITIHTGSFVSYVCITTSMCRYSVTGATCPTKGTRDSHYASAFALQNGGVELQIGGPYFYAGGKFGEDNGARCGE